MKQILQLNLSFDVLDAGTKAPMRSEQVHKTVYFEDDGSHDEFTVRLESLLNQILRAYVPDYEFRKNLKVTRLEAKPGDVLIIEVEHGTISPSRTQEIELFLKSMGFKDVQFVYLNPGRGELKYTVIGKEKDL